MKNLSQKLSISVIALALSAGAAAAGDMNKDDVAVEMKTKTESDIGVSIRNYDKSTPAQEAAVNDTLDELLQSNGAKLDDADKGVLMSDGTEETKGDLLAAESDDEIASNAIVVPLLNEAPITTVSCPIGTTAQPDMTCLITGDYQP